MLVDCFGSTVSIRQVDQHRFKFADGITEYMWIRSMDGGADHADGDSECPTGWFCRFGKRVLFANSQGFVWTEKWPDERGATQVVEALSRYYSIWSNEEDYDWEDPRRDAHLAEAAAYAAYVAICATENLEAHEFDQWVTQGKPKGPI